MAELVVHFLNTVISKSRVNYFHYLEDPELVCFCDSGLIHLATEETKGIFLKITITRKQLLFSESQDNFAELKNWHLVYLTTADFFKITAMTVGDDSHLNNKSRHKCQVLFAAVASFRLYNRLM